MAKKALETAFSMDSTDARVFFELDQLYKMLNYDVEARLNFLNAHMELLTTRDDLYMEYISLLNEISTHHDYELCLIIVTYIIHNCSYFYYNENASTIMKNAFFEKEVKQGFYLKNVVSRKKQVLPCVLEVMDGK